MKLQSITKLSAENKIYLPEIEKLWNNLKRVDKEPNQIQNFHLTKWRRKEGKCEPLR